MIRFIIDHERHIIIGMMILNSLLYFVFVVLSNELTPLGKKIAELDEEIGRLKSENELLEIKIANEGSLRTIGERARSMGFIDAGPENVIYLPDL
jgi:cell division protein FtsL